MSHPVSTFDLSSGPATVDPRSWEYLASRRFVLTVANLEPRAVAFAVAFHAPAGTLTAGRVGDDGRDLPANHRWTWRVGHITADDGALRPAATAFTSPALVLGPGEAGVFELAPRAHADGSRVTRVGSVTLRPLPRTPTDLAEGTPGARLLLTPETHVVYAPPKSVVADEPFIAELDHGVVPLPTATGRALFELPSLPALPAGERQRLELLAGRPLELSALRRTALAGDMPGLRALLGGDEA